MLQRPVEFAQYTITFTDHLIDPVEEGVDLAIRFGELGDMSGVVAPSHRLPAMGDLCVSRLLVEARHTGRSRRCRIAPVCRRISPGSTTLVASAKRWGRFSLRSTSDTPDQRRRGDDRCVRGGSRTLSDAVVVISGAYQCGTSRDRARRLSTRPCRRPCSMAAGRSLATKGPLYRGLAGRARQPRPLRLGTPRSDAFSPAQSLSFLTGFVFRICIAVSANRSITTSRSQRLPSSRWTRACQSK